MRQSRQSSVDSEFVRGDSNEEISRRLAARAQAQVTHVTVNVGRVFWIMQTVLVVALLIITAALWSETRRLSNEMRAEREILAEMRAEIAASNGLSEINRERLVRISRELGVEPKGK